MEKFKESKPKSRLERELGPEALKILAEKLLREGYEPNRVALWLEYSLAGKHCMARRLLKKQICGARRKRDGLPCLAAQVVPDEREPNGRCRFHGGMSTGPKTIEGRERIRQGQLRRWAAYREKKEAQQLADILS